MIYNVYFEVSAAAFMLTLYVYMHLQYNLRSDKNRTFRLLVLFAFWADVLDVVSAITISYWKAVPVPVNVTVNVVYLLVDAVLGYLFVVYVQNYLARGRQSRILLRLNHIVMGLYVAVLALNYINGWVFYFSPEGGYTHGPLYLIVFAIPFYFITNSSVCLLQNYNSFELKKKVSILLYILIGFTGPVLQLVLFPHVLLGMFTISLEVLMMFFSMETPDYQKQEQTMRELEETREEADRAREEAQRANRAKTEFLTSMSHEIHTPINAIMGMNEMILRECEEETICSYAREVEKSGKMLLSLVNNIMDFAQIDEKEVRVLPVKYQIRTVLEDILNMYSSRVRDKGLQLKSEIDRRLPERLYGDQIHIRQIVSNLLYYAMRYTEEGEITLTANFKNSDSNGNYIELYIGVRDTGRGMSDEEKEHLLDYFEGYNKKGGGVEDSAAGLILVKTLAEKMDGKFGFDTEYGKGSTFYVRIRQRVLAD